LTVPRPDDATRFFAVAERDVPPVIVFSENFDGPAPGWTTGFDPADTLMNTVWELGIPTLVGPPAANSGANCYGTNLAANYGRDSNTWLRTPSAPGIDLTTATGATLVFQQWVDMDDFDFGDTGTVRVLKAGDLPGTVTELGVVKTNIQGLDPAGWAEFSAQLPAAALGETIALEFRFVSDDYADADASGWYIDDVTVTANQSP
ncbi:MAG: choice-of-anchor J domain-containing protein, partial [Verrucomicrobia bacterium]|nr:choice-of-anchor J domain-containing protein [Verrucomicrobiota bacterium]